MNEQHVNNIILTFILLHIITKYTQYILFIVLANIYRFNKNRDKRLYTYIYIYIIKMYKNLFTNKYNRRGIYFFPTSCFDCL